MAKTIIVTGGCGYIGSHTTVALIQAGYDVVIFDNLVNSNKNVLDGIYKITKVRPAFENIDCTNRAALQMAFSKYKHAIGVIHFAALKAVGESVAQPIKYYRNNITALINVLDAMREYEIPNIVFSSSATVYGDAEKLPVTEQTPLQPATSPYGQTKVIGENIISDVVRANKKIHACLLRYFNPIGAHPTGLIGELPNGIPNNLLPYITQTAVGIREKLMIFGNDYDTPDGFCVRDYIDVNDLASAHVRALEYMTTHDKGISIFNLGTGRGTSVMEMVRAFEQANNIKIPYEITARRPGDVPAVWADPSLANHELGWAAQTPLIATLQSAWRWQLHIGKKSK